MTDSFVDRIPNPGDHVAYYPHKDDVPERFGKVIEIRQWEGFRKGPGDGTIETSYSPPYMKMKPGEPVRVTALRALVAWQRDEGVGVRSGERQSIVDTKFLKVINVEAIPHVIDTRPRLVFTPDGGQWEEPNDPWSQMRPYVPRPAFEAARAEDV